jgi:hypothetical protein
VVRSTSFHARSTLYPFAIRLPISPVPDNPNSLFVGEHTRTISVSRCSRCGCAGVEQLLLKQSVTGSLLLTRCRSRRRHQRLESWRLLLSILSASPARRQFLMPKLRCESTASHVKLRYTAASSERSTRLKRSFRAYGHSASAVKEVSTRMCYALLATGEKDFLDSWYNGVTRCEISSILPFCVL